MSYSDKQFPSSVLACVHYVYDFDHIMFQVSTATKTRAQREEGLSMINYVHSDCGTFSDRDHLIEMIQRHINVDSYGKCLHNKDLPKQ